MPKNDENFDPKLEIKLVELRRIDRELVAEVDRKTSELIRLRLAVAEQRRLALARKAEWRRQIDGRGG
jgi:hypothetical protein